MDEEKLIAKYELPVDDPKYMAFKNLKGCLSGADIDTKKRIIGAGI